MKSFFYICILLSFSKQSYMLEMFPQFDWTVQMNKREGTVNGNLTLSPSQSTLSYGMYKDMDLSGQERILHMYCMVNELHKDYQLQEMKLCFQKLKDPTDTSEFLYDHKLCFDANKAVKHRGVDIKFDSISNTRGFHAQFQWIEKSPDGGAEGYYYCKLKNENGEYLSNFVELRDLIYYNKFLLTKIGGAPNLKVDVASLPQELQCSPPQVANPSFQFPHYFKTINKKSMFVYDECEDENCVYITAKLVYPLNMNDFDYTVSPTGNLTIHAMWNKPKNIIRCVSANYVYNNYAVNGAPSSYTGTDIISKSDLVQNVQLTIGELPSHLEAKLSVNYVADPKPGVITFQWLKDGKPVPSNYFKTPSGMTKYNLIFVNNVIKEMAGEYKVTIAHIKSQASQTFTFQVTTVSPPAIASTDHDWPSFIFVKNGGAARLVCNMDRATSRNITIYSRKMVQIKDGSESISMTNLGDAKISLTPPNVNAAGPVTYSVSNLKFSPMSDTGPSHLVTCEGKNSVGLVRVSSVIVVLKPIMLEPRGKPFNFNCLDCNNTAMHNISCRFNTTFFEQKTSIKVRQIWKVNGIIYTRGNDEDFYKYLDLSDDDKTLTISNIDLYSPTYSLWRDTGINITCGLELIDPVTDVVIDSSDEYPDLQPQLLAMFTFASNIGQAGIHWLVIVIVVIILVIILIILCIVCCLRRPKEKAYNVDAKERAQGNDPEKEIKELETFHAYERPEGAPLHGRKTSLSEESLGVGSDDEGELEDYAADGKFNEEGSFIGKYANNK